MSPRCLRADARRIVLNGVAKLVAYEHRNEFESTEEETTPEILEACRLIQHRWDDGERMVRWLVAHSIGNIAAESHAIRKELSYQDNHEHNLAQGRLRMNRKRTPAGF